MTSPALTGIAHHTAAVNGTELHYVSAGTTGSPVLLVHGFPESWWAFRRLIQLPATRPLTMPVLAVGAAGGPFTAATVRQVTAGPVESVQLDGVGHYAALEAPGAVSSALLGFLGRADTQADAE